MEYGGASTPFVLGRETERLGFPLGPRRSFRVGEQKQSVPATLTAALDRAILDSIGESPVYVEFSGGCDSSLVLAAATRVCRTTGHDDPIPVTHRFESVESTEEHEFQELVVRNLQLQDWKVHTFALGEADLLGPAATESLSRLGLVWPATLHYRSRVFAALAPGVLLTGEGGDEVLGLRRSSWLAESVRQVWRGHRLPSQEIRSRALSALAPRRVRRRRVCEELENDFRPHWLEAGVRDSLLNDLADLSADEPLQSSKWGRFYLGLPSVWIGMNNIRAFGTSLGLQIEAPLLSEPFVETLQSTVPWWEYRGRNILLRHHFSDLLPPELMDRRSKAEFSEAYFGMHTRAFAEDWDGSGLPEGVDGRWLKEHWSSAPQIHGGTALLLHQAWLASNAPARISVDGDGSAGA